MNDNVYKILFKLLKKSLRHGDVPVSAVIVKNNKIIAKSYNTREKKKFTINHAEINTIRKANKKLKSYFLYDCDLYVTLKPCEMCQKVIDNSRINNVYYLLDKPTFKKEFNKTKYVYISNIYSDKYKKILTNFFNKIR